MPFTSNYLCSLPVFFNLQWFSVAGSWTWNVLLFHTSLPISLSSLALSLLHFLLTLHLFDCICLMSHTANTDLNIIPVHPRGRPIHTQYCHVTPPTDPKFFFSLSLSLQIPHMLSPRCGLAVDPKSMCQFVFCLSSHLGSNVAYFDTLLLSFGTREITSNQNRNHGERGSLWSQSSRRENCFPEYMPWHNTWRDQNPATVSIDYHTWFWGYTWIQMSKQYIWHRCGKFLLQNIQERKLVSSKAISFLSLQTLFSSKVMEDTAHHNYISNSQRADCSSILNIISLEPEGH